MANNGKNSIDFQLNFLKGDMSALESLKKELNNLKQLAANESLFSGQGQQVTSLVSNIQTVENALNKAFNPKLNTINVQKFNQILAQSGQNARTLQESFAVAGAQGDKAFLRLTSQLMQFNGAVRQSNAFLDKLAVSFFNTVKWTIMSSAVKNISGSIQKAYYYVKDLDRSLNDIRIVTNKSAEDMENFAVEANNAAKALAVTTEDYTKGSLIYYQQGLDDKTVKTLTDITAKTSNVTGQSMETVSEQLTAVWNGYQVANEAAKEGMGVYEKYVDKLAAVGATTASDMEELSKAMSKVASAASSMGVGFDDLNAQIATIVSVTRQAPESVGTALKTIYARLGDLKVDGVDEFGTKLGEVSASLQTMGINILDTNGDMRDMSSVIAEVAEKWDKWTSAQRQAAAIAMAGKRQYNNLVALFDNWDMYGEALETSMNAAGTLEKQQEIALDSLANKMDILKATAEDLYDSMIDENTIKGFVEGLTSVVQLLANFADATGGLNNLLPLLGATALNVFSNQISQSLGTMIINMRNVRDEQELMQQNQMALQQMFSDSSLFTVNNINDSAEVARKEALQETVNLYKELVPYASIMTKEEREQYDFILKQSVKAGELKTKIAEMTESINTNENSWKLIDQDSLKTLNNVTKIVNQASQLNKTGNALSGLLSAYSKPNTNQFMKALRNSFVDQNDPMLIQIEDRFNSLIASGSKVGSAIRSITEDIIKLGGSSVELVQFKSNMDGCASSAQNFSVALKEGLDTKALINGIIGTIGALGQLAMAISTVQNLGKIMKNDNLSDSEKLTQVFMNLSMVIMTLKFALQKLNAEVGIFNILQGVWVSVSTRLGVVLGTQTAATAAATQAQKGLNAAMAANPFGLVALALMAIVGAITAVISYYDKLKEKAKESADEARKASEELRNEADAHSELVSNYEKAYEEYKKGNIQKQELWETTDKLIDAYDLENARLELVAENYDAVAEAAKKARAEEEKEVNRKNKETIDKSKENFAQQARGGLWDDTSLSGDKLTVDMAISDPTVLGGSEIESIYKNIFAERDTNDNRKLSVDTSNTADIIAFYQDLLRYEEELKKAGYETSNTYINLQNIIENFKSENAIENLISDVDNYSKGILDSLHFEEVTSDSEFQTLIEQARKELLNIVPEDEIDNKISSYLSKIHTALTDQFFIDNTIEQKFGDKVNEGLLEAFKKLDPALQSELLSKYHFDLTMDEVEGKRKLQEYVNYITGSTEGVYSIPFEMQMSMNDTILKGKDINKSDWEGLTAAVPNAEETLGSREEFNNKSIGERITLMEELNQKIQEEAHLHIESYQAWKDGQEAIKSGLEEQINLIKDRIQVEKDRPVNSFEDVEEKKQKIKELENELEDLSKQKYQIDLELNADYFADNIDSLLGGMIGEVTTQADQLKVAAESVGEAWTIAAEDVQNFASVFPELMAEASNFDWLEDGSIQLTELGRQLLNETLENNEQIMNSNKEVVLEAIDDKIAQLKADANFQKSRIEALEEYLSSEVSNTENKEKLIQKLNKATVDYEDTLREQNLTQEATAQTIKNNIANQGNVGLVEGLKSVNDNIAAVRESYANIFNVNYSGSLPGYQGSSPSITSSYTKGMFDEAAENLDAETKAFVEEAEKQLEDAKKQLSEDLLEIASYEGAAAEIRQRTSEAKKASDRVQSGKAGKEPKSSKSGGSKDKKKKEEELKKLDEEFDRYWEIHKALEQIDRDLKKIDKDQEHLNGPELIESLQKENELLEQKKERYQQLYEAQQAEAAQLRGQLSGMGVQFDAATGAILNYAEATAAALALYNAAVEAFNNGPQDEAAEKTLKAAEKAFEDFKKLLERYDTLFYTEMQETQEHLDDIWRQEMENKLKAWETKIEIELDKTKLERQWDEFITKAKKDIKKVFSDLTIDSKSAVKQGLSNAEDVTTIINAQHEVEADMDRMQAGGESQLGFQSIADARNKLKELNDQMIESGNAVYDAYQQALDNYLDGIDQVADKFGKINDEFDRQNDNLQYQRELIELLYGDDNYDLMEAYYEGQEKANLNNIDSMRQQKEFWEKQWKDSGAAEKDRSEWNQDQEKFYENMIEAEQTLHTLELDNLKLAKERHDMQVDAAFKDEEEELKKSKEEWEKIKDHASKYYDSVESTYQIQKLSSKYDQSISQANSLAAQQKLNKLKEEELAKLREKKKVTGELSQYEVQAADLRYQLALREIALEEAQNNKTNMKVTRDEEGNWTYQYVADDSDVESKRQELLDAYNELYQLSSDAYEENLEAMMNLKEEYLERAKEIAKDTTLTEEEKKEKLDELNAEYYEEYNRLADENSTIRQDLASETAGFLVTMYNQDENAVKSMTKDEINLVKTLSKENIKDYNDIDKAVQKDYKNIGTITEKVMKDSRKDWTSTAQTIVDKWNKNGDSVRAQVEDTYNKIKASDETYRNTVHKTAEKAGADYGENGIKGAINKAQEATNDLNQETEQLARDGERYLSELRSYVNQLESAWRSVCQQIQNAIGLLRQYLQMVGQARSTTPTTAEIAPSTTSTPTTTTTTGGTGDKDRNLSGGENNVTYDVILDRDRTGHANVTTKSGVNKSDAERIAGDWASYNFHGKVVDSNGKVIKRFATGGYTGEWGDSSGKLALLHQKELVLNADDTANMLSMVKTVRDLNSGLNNSIQDAVLKAVAKTAISMGRINTNRLGEINNTVDNSTGNIFNITAEFPNANDVDEIRQAILSLPNLASQYIHRNVI